mmetsp:Transcript_22862/g.49459  ORF Transcript_22862/g.49459 Transcript_22862/m.49459 type:complete len:404 (+) Transcript_22862:122-1333(+)|eukprot:CAMPEP_0172315084 /NCGR_PEP_ID=MMETSP1058-20130122/24054_1 /TAXON_ID=83371 /ORGANISM="Detonula confervacea, Strain CCMP 353" /LENGTH=403 /DNA_ID=CAMNT_0013029081 /DNA_START=198 /DNA_END=1409 /DNA_ORIENTATION=+
MDHGARLPGHATNPMKKNRSKATSLTVFILGLPLLLFSSALSFHIGIGLSAAGQNGGKPLLTHLESSPDDSPLENIVVKHPHDDGAYSSEDNDSNNDIEAEEVQLTFLRKQLYNPNENQLQLPTAATHPRPPLPYKCGVLLFYHIPSTGGASISTWLRKYKKPENGGLLYFHRFGTAIKKSGLFTPDPELKEEEFIDLMNAHVENLGPNEWRTTQLHLMNPPLNTTEYLYYDWREKVESQGCQMISAVMLRDPLNHAMSLYKIMKSKNATRDVWMDHLRSPTGTGKWSTVLDFFLYNTRGPIGRNPYNVSKETKVLRAMELLERHFDVVSMGDHAQFMGDILDMTGWPVVDMPHTNVYKKELNYTKKEVETLYKLLVNNGDIDFVDAVKQKYRGHLSYLMAYH